MTEDKNLVILMAEDDDGHARLVQERFAEVGVYNKIIRFRDGAEIWTFLSGAGQESLEPEGSYLLLLDIRMPRMDGVEVLERVKADPRLKSIPVVMLTTADDPVEIGRCELELRGYLVKPVEFAKFSEVIKRLGLFLLVIKVGNLKGG